MHGAHRGQGCGDLYIAFNAHTYPITVGLPAGHSWVRVVDTNLPSPRDFTVDNDKVLGGDYTVNPFSSIMLKAVAA